MQKKHFLLVCLLLLVQVVQCHGVELVVHPDEKPHLLKLIDRLGLNVEGFQKDNRDDGDKNYTNFGREFGSYKDRYWFNGKHYNHLLFITDHNDRIIKIKIDRTSFKELHEVKYFSNLVWLNIHLTDIATLEGLERLSKLEKIELGGSENLFSLAGVRNLPALKVLNADTSGVLNKLSNIKNLPKLEAFYCGHCDLASVSNLSRFKNLKRLKLGGKFKDISGLKTLKKLEYLYLRSEEVNSLDVVNELDSLEEIFVWVGNAKSFNFTKFLPKLKDVHVVDNPIESIPDLSKAPNLEKFTVTNSNLKEVKLPKSHEKLEILALKAAKNLSKISKIENMPALEELSLSNSKIENIEFGLLPSLKKLTLSGTNIQELKGFNNFPELTELWLMDTKVKTIEPLLDAPKLHRVMLDKTAREMPNLLLILDVLGDNYMSKYSKEAPQNARKVYEQKLAAQQEEVEQPASKRQGRRSRN